MWTSVPQIVVRLILINASPGPGSGRATSRNLISPFPRNTAARIVAMRHLDAAMSTGHATTLSCTRAIVQVQDAAPAIARKRCATGGLITESMRASAPREVRRADDGA